MVGREGKERVEDDAQDRLTPIQAAEIIGVSVTTLAIWRSRKRYSLKWRKIGGRIYYRLSDIHDFLKSGERGGSDF